MAVSIGELLGEARDYLDARRAAGVDADTAIAAAAGLAPIGRALELVYGYRPYAPWDDESRPPEAAGLTAACRDAGRAWPGESGRLADLLGAAADAIGTNSRSFSHEQRWAVTEELAETARRCVDTAAQFPAYARIPQLQGVRAAAVACERHAILFPTTAADRAPLDRLVPGRHLTSDASERVVDAVAALHLALTGRGYYPQLCMAEVLITVNAAHLATAHAVGQLPTPTAAASAAPQAWRAARQECAGFDDGTKLRPPETSPVAAAAARLGRNLLDCLGLAQRSTAGIVARQGTDVALLATLHPVIQMLPDIADSLGHAAHVWAAQRLMWAPERQLLSYEDRNDTVTSMDRTAPADYHDMEGLRHALTLAGSLTTSLNVDIRAELIRGHPELLRQPHVGEARAAAAEANRYVSIHAQSAHDAVRRAHALRPQEWALQAVPQPTQVPRR